MLNSPNEYGGKYLIRDVNHEKHKHARDMYTFETELVSFSRQLTISQPESTIQRAEIRKATVTPLPLDRPGSYCVLPRRPFFR